MLRSKPIESPLQKSVLKRDKRNSILLMVFQQSDQKTQQSSLSRNGHVNTMFLVKVSAVAA